MHTPLLIVHGETSAAKSGILRVLHQGSAYPPLYFEVNSGFFKAAIHLDPGPNPLFFTHYSGQIVNGYPQQDGRPSFKDETVSFTVNYTPLLQNKPIHLCLLLAKDSPGLFDSTTDRTRLEGGNDLGLAIKKMRIAGRLMQAFTHEQMLRTGFGNRTFNFVEEYTEDTTFASEQHNFRNTIKVHILRSRKTLKELRDPNLAQQNSKGTNTGGLFGIAMEALRDYGGPFINTHNDSVQAAVMFLDAHWDPKLKLILTHAALGGGDDKIKLAIFGSHGIYSWPTCLEQVPFAFQDTTKSNINEVANDSNQCDTYWECLNITLGAFMHEIGHLLGCPHQTHGVMLRDYVTLNRSFLTREAPCSRTKSSGFAPVLPKDECTWHRLDLLRFLHHPSFTLPEDYLDPTFQKNNCESGKAILLPLGGNNALLKSATGIYAIEIYKGDLAHASIEYLPKSIGGEGSQKEILVNTDEMRSRLPRDKQEGSFDVHVLSIDGSQSNFNNFEKLVAGSENFIQSDFGLGRGQLTGIKSSVFGDSNRGEKQPLVIFDSNRIANIRVYHGGALDGIRIDQSAPRSGSVSTAPPLPKRDYKSHLGSAFKKLGLSDTGSQQVLQPVQGSVLYGKQTNNFTDFPFQPGEKITDFKLRSGAWVDAIQIFTDHNRCSPMLGKTDGGGEGTLTLPQGFEIVGLFGSVSNWIDSIGVVYVPK